MAELSDADARFPLKPLAPRPPGQPCGTAADHSIGIGGRFHLGRLGQVVALLHAERNAGRERKHGGRNQVEEQARLRGHVA